jgi:hypothetical protein
VQAVAAHRRLREAVDHGSAFDGLAFRDRFLLRKEVVLRTSFLFDDQSTELIPKRRIGNRYLANPLALREDRQSLPVMVEVLELDALERAFAEPEVDEEEDREPIPHVLLRGDDRPPLIFGEVRPSRAPH